MRTGAPRSCSAGGPVVYTCRVPGRSTGRERAYQYLRDEVLVDPSVQGTFLNELDLATRVGVSRTPVREALLLLVSEGLVELVPQRGAYVPVLTGRQVSELMDLRGALERHAATRTVAAGTVPFAALEEALDQQRLLLGGGGGTDAARRFIEWDRVFHSVLVDAVGNGLLSSTYANLRVRQVRIGVQALYSAAGRQETVCEEHRRIVDALAAGDVAEAHAAIDEHLQVTLRVLLAA
nr:GntR family transcriptional regulator [Kineococcus radiotolerans]